MSKTLIGTLLEFDNSIPKGLSGCEEVGLSGSCMNNCYKCSEAYGFEMDDDEIRFLFGEEEQKMMLYDYQNKEW